jgi:hypothetical protein
MDQLMRERLEDLDGVLQRRRYKHVVALVVGRVLGVQHLPMRRVVWATTSPQYVTEAANAAARLVRPAL